MVGDGHGVQPHPRCHPGQALDGDGAVRTGGMIVKIAGHCVSSHESPKSTRPKRANAFSASYKYLVLIEIDQAAVGQDLAFVRGQRSHIQGERLDGPAQHIGGDVLQVALEGFADVGDEDVVPSPNGVAPASWKGSMPQLMRLER